jgi:murein DD-endopeptidase MepM/ murein hydrolase activator NlpD
MLDFNGIVNQELEDLNNLDSGHHWRQTWDNNVPYLTDNNLALMDDTVTLCIVDSNHNKFCIPHPGMVTSTFKYRGKRFHYGIDVDLVTGDTLSAAWDGIVRYAQYNKSGFGNLVIIRHFNGLETYYAHQEKLFVHANQEVKAGDHIGLGGKTGRAYGDHLHFEIRFYYNAIDPEEIIDFKTHTLKNDTLLIHKGLFDYRKVSTTKTHAVKHTSPTETESGTPDVKYHKIKSGDSLYALALKYKTTVNALCELNKISKSKILHTGDMIQLYE